MKITINGVTRDVTPELGVAEAAAQYAGAGGGVVVQLNGAVIRRDQWSAHTLRDGDRLDILRLVGGG